MIALPYLSFFNSRAACTAPREYHVTGSISQYFTLQSWDPTQELPHASFADCVFKLLPGKEDDEALDEIGVCPLPDTDDDDDDLDELLVGPCPSLLYITTSFIANLTLSR